jgi:hypothetical protein
MDTAERFGSHQTHSPRAAKRLTPPVLGPNAPDPPSGKFTFFDTRIQITPPVGQRIRPNFFDFAQVSDSTALTLPIAPISLSTSALDAAAAGKERHDEQTIPKTDDLHRDSSGLLARLPDLTFIS